MASNTKITLRKKANKEGLYPLTIRITKDRRSSYMYVGHYIDIKHWDENKRAVRKSHPDSDTLNTLLLAKLSEANKALMDMQTENQDISSNQIKGEITSTIAYTSFEEVAQDYLKELENNNKLTRLFTDRVRVNHVLNFHKSKQLTFQEIDEGFLRRFQNYLRNKKNLSERSIVNNLVVIRTLYNRAIKTGIVQQKRYPFGLGKIQIKFPETEKVGLTIEEVQKIENLEGLSEPQEHARNVWLFSFYLAGIRVGDVLKIRWSDIYDGRIHYRMNKNSKLVSLKLPDKLLPILRLYESSKQHPQDFIFSELKKADLKNDRDIYAKTNTATKKFNKYLKQVAAKANIEKVLTMHIARHSFGNIAGDRIPVQLLQKLYRHSSVTTTIQYQSNFITNKTDEALDDVVNF